MNEWISVEDKLPEIDCLLLYDDGAIETWQVGDWGDINDVMDSSSSWKLTHWMPLPEPPAERNE